MKKLRYYYNPKTLNYEKVEISWKKRLGRLTGWFSTTLVFAVILFLIYISNFQLPGEANKNREIAKLKMEYRLLQNEMEDANAVLAELQKRDENIYRIIFEAEPLNTSIREAGYGGSSMFERFKGYDNEEIMRETDSTLQRIKRKLYVQSKSYDELTRLLKNKEAMLAAIPAIQPISNEELERLASGFGYRVHPVYKQVKFHEGIDFTAKKGTEVYATGDGVVIEAGNEHSGYGNLIVINHGYGYQTRYAHLDRFAVKAGQKVKRGELIGYVGNTGLSTAPHLHYEVVKSGEKIDPINFFYSDLSPEEYDRLIRIANTTNQSFD